MYEAKWIMRREPVVECNERSSIKEEDYKPHILKRRDIYRNRPVYGGGRGHPCKVTLKKA